MVEIIKLATEKGFKTGTVSTAWVKINYDENDPFHKKGIVKVLHRPICDYLYLCELQKWLRDEKRIITIIYDVEVSTGDRSGYRWKWYISDRNKPEEEGQIDCESLKPIGYGYFHEALKGSIEEALKLIS